MVLLRPLTSYITASSSQTVTIALHRYEVRSRRLTHPAGRDSLSQVNQCLSPPPGLWFRPPVISLISYEMLHATILLTMQSYKVRSTEYVGYLQVTYIQLRHRNTEYSFIVHTSYFILRAKIRTPTSSHTNTPCQCRESGPQSMQNAPDDVQPPHHWSTVQRRLPETSYLLRLGLWQTTFHQRVGQ